jgi:heat-inducible transcriptional repressor
MSHPAFSGGASREDPELSDRQRRIFLALVEMHRHTARAVSSEALHREAGVPGSAAGIRGAMAELESLGLLRRDHASAARVPSGEGWAWLIRNEVAPAELPPDMLRAIDERLRASSHDVARLLAEASRLLSELAQQLGLAVATSLDREVLVHLDLEPIAPERAMLVLGFGGGAARTLMLRLDNPLSPGELRHVATVLRERLVPRPLSEARDMLANDAALVRDTAVRLVAEAARASWTASAGMTAIYTAGAGHIATQPEFAAQGRLGPLLRVVESGPPLDRLMIAGIEGQAGVRVALDEDAALSGCSLVSFTLPGSLRGGVGVLGPLRMDYALAVAVVDAVGGRVAGYL